MVSHVLNKSVSYNRNMQEDKILRKRVSHPNSPILVYYILLCGETGSDLLALCLSLMENPDRPLLVMMLHFIHNNFSL